MNDFQHWLKDLSVRQICHVVLAKRGRHPARAATLLMTAARTGHSLAPVSFCICVCAVLRYHIPRIQLDTSLSVAFYSVNSV